MQRLCFHAKSLADFGTTGARNGGAVSEIYVNEFRGVPELHGDIHELMHNKLRMGDELHWNGGQGLAGDVMNINTCAAPFNSFHLTEENKRLMAEKLADQISKFHAVAEPGRVGKRPYRLPTRNRQIGGREIHVLLNLAQRMVRMKGLLCGGG